MMEDEDPEWSDYGRGHGPALLLAWILLLSFCVALDGLAAWGVLALINHR